MTKARAPSTFPDAITRIAGRIGWAAMADAVGMTERAVRNWSDPDAGRAPTLTDALALDAAYLAAGGGEPPIMAVYQLLMDRAVQPPADSAALASVGGLIAKEAGEGLAALIKAAQPGASPIDRAIAERELTEAAEAIGTGLRMLGGGDNVRTLRA